MGTMSIWIRKRASSPHICARTRKHMQFLQMRTMKHLEQEAQMCLRDHGESLNQENEAPLLGSIYNVCLGPDITLSNLCCCWDHTAKAQHSTRGQDCCKSPNRWLGYNRICIWRIQSKSHSSGTVVSYTAKKNLRVQMRDKLLLSRVPLGNRETGF